MWDLLASPADWESEFLVPVWHGKAASECLSRNCGPTGEVVCFLLLDAVDAEDVIARLPMIVMREFSRFSA